MAYYGYVAQGDTDNASDCRVAYNKLAAKYGSSNSKSSHKFPNNDTRPAENHLRGAGFILCN